jgi:hypothetical protein
MKSLASEYIHPEDINNVIYWCKKFGVSPRELNEAILQTGKLDAKTVKDFLKKDSWWYHPISGTTKLVKHTISFIF